MANYPAPVYRPLREGDIDDWQGYADDGFMFCETCGHVAMPRAGHARWHADGRAEAEAAERG